MDIKEIIDLSRALCQAPGISGREAEGQTSAAAVARGLLAPLGDVTTSYLGSLICTVSGGKAGAPHLVLEAHLDQIGMVVTCVEENGFLRVAKVGGVDRRLLPAMPMVIRAKTGDYPAVAASTPPHLSGGEEKPQKLDDMVIDTGFSTDRCKELFSPGDAVIMDGPFTLMGEDCIISGAQDDRAGCVAVIAAARQIARDKPACKVTVLLSSMEEVGGQGAQTAAYALRPDMAIAVDVSFADGFGVPKHRSGRMGGGPMIGTAPILDKGMSARLTALAAEQGIDSQPEVMSGRTHTDADAIATAGPGVRTALLSIPLRNMHTGVEVSKATDILRTAQLMAAFAKEVG